MAAFARARRRFEPRLARSREHVERVWDREWIGWGRWKRRKDGRRGRATDEEEEEKEWVHHPVGDSPSLADLSLIFHQTLLHHHHFYRRTLSVHTLSSVP
jgi:hypothetical protein